RRLYLAEAERERREMVMVPATERAEVNGVLSEWGYEAAALEDLLDRIILNPRAMLEFMMAFELKLSPVEAEAPKASAFVVGTATVLGHFGPLIPFFFVMGNVLLGAVLSVTFSAAALFGIGWY